MKLFKELECSAVIGFTACGSLKDDLKPGELYPINQFIDLTSGRKLEYPKEVTHMSMGEPFDKKLTEIICTILQRDSKTMITINGPRFSTRAESSYFRTIGGDLINMTTSTECIATNIENIPYAAVAFVTDYDSWNTEIPHVTIEEIKSRFTEYRLQLKDFVPKLLDSLTKI
jgi:5'-methylthioadenosine phosphorylase